MIKNKNFYNKKKKSIRKNERKTKKVILAIILIVFFVFVAWVLYLIGSVRAALKNSNSYVVVVRQSNNNVHIHIINPIISEYVVLAIPSQTYVDASHNLGKWRVGSIWQLGIDDGVGGEYLRKTILKEFNLPVQYWADSRAENFFQNNINEILPLLSGNFNSNMNLSTKLTILYVSNFLIPKDEKKFVDHEDTGMVYKSQLPDGEDGYLVRDVLPKKYLPFFVIHEIENAKIKLINSGIYSTELENLTKSIEVLGGKVALTESGEDFDGVCKVYTTYQNLSEYLANIFDCVIDNDNQKLTGGGFDIVMEFGPKFTTVN